MLDFDRNLFVAGDAVQYRSIHRGDANTVAYFLQVVIIHWSCSVVAALCQC